MNLDGHIPQTKLNSIGSILDNDSRMLNVVDVKTVKMRVKYFDNIPMKKLMNHEVIIIVPHHTFLPQNEVKTTFLTLMLQWQVIGLIFAGNF